VCFSFDFKNTEASERATEREREIEVDGGGTKSHSALRAYYAFLSLLSLLSRERGVRRVGGGGIESVFILKPAFIPLVHRHGWSPRCW
jgi:hypothetical protein